MRALVSVYDKTDLVAFVERLVNLGVEIVSSGGTAEALMAAGLDVERVSDVTGSPEMLGGRVKTLHPKIHGAILARGPEDDSDLQEAGIRRFDLVVCNLYPFSETLASGAPNDEIVEKIDIGGPAMVRAAAKNHRFVTVVTSPDQYSEVADAFEDGGPSDEMRRRLAAEAFFHTAAYDAAIVGWLGDDRVLPLRHVSELRYGENPHQEAHLYRLDGADSWWSSSILHQGKEMSFNNYADTEAAWHLATALGPGAVVVVKHTNAAGAAVGKDPLETFEAAWGGDPLAAFGGVVAIDGPLTVDVGQAIADRFVEVVVARSVGAEALQVLASKKNLRILTTSDRIDSGPDYRGIEGGFLAQTPDSEDGPDWSFVSDRPPTDPELASLRFAWTVAAHAKSNAIVIANGMEAVGVGAGDQSRVGAGERAVAKAGDRAKGSVAASDAFFPFRDGLDVLAEAGITAVVEPGGSRNDQELIDAANEHGVALVFTGERHFRH